jgi:hypothetical protein
MIGGQNCTRNPRNVCIKRKKYRDDELLIADYDIYMVDRKNPKDEDGEMNTVEVPVSELLKNMDKTIKDYKVFRLNNNTDQEEEVMLKDRVHRAFTKKKIYTLYLTLDESDTYKFIIQLQKGFEMDYYRLFRIASHAVKDLVYSLKSKDYGNRFNPRERLNKMLLSGFGIKVFRDGTNSSITNNLEIHINYINFDPAYKLVF